MKKKYIIFSLLCLTSALSYTETAVAPDPVVQREEQPLSTQSEQKKQERIPKEEVASTVVADVPEKVEPDIYTIDSIKAVIFSPEGVEIITQSDIERPGLTGANRSLDEIVFEKLVFFDAKKHRVTPDDDAVDKYLASVQKDNNITLDELKEVFKSAGYTFKEGRDQFKVMQAVNIMLDFKIRSNLIVPRKEVEAYYEQHPELKEARYQLEYAIVPFDTAKDKEKQLKEINQLLAGDKIETHIPWGNPFWVNRSDVAEEKKFICDLQSGQVSTPRKCATGFEVYRLKEKEEEQARSLDDRRLDIMDILRRPRYFQLLEEYKNTIFSTASILYL